MPSEMSLRELSIEFDTPRRIALPIAGTIVWTIAGILGAILPTDSASIGMFICVGMAFPLGILIGRLRGENVVGKTELNRLMTLNVVMASLTWGIAIPFYNVDPSSLPLSLGILAGSMWVPLSWIIQHWIGVFHGVARTVLIVISWYAFPTQRFVIIPAVIVLIYLFSIYVLATRKIDRSPISGDG